MGCDIHSYAERKTDDGFEVVEGLNPFDWRQYGMYGFLADVRNYSDIKPISPQRGFPADASKFVAEEHDHWSSDAHSASWLLVEELTAFDYDAPMEDRRVTIDNDGGRTAPPGGGTMTTYREFFGPRFFEDLEEIKRAGATRVIFWFDN